MTVTTPKRDATAFSELEVDNLKSLGNRDVTRKATDDGTGTGLIGEFDEFVIVDADGDANHQLTLPTPVVGKYLTIVVPTANNCELIASGASVKINDVICSETNEAALVADSHYGVTCVSTTEWILVGYDNLGAHAAAIVPNGL